VKTSSSALKAEAVDLVENAAATTHDLGPEATGSTSARAVPLRQVKLVFLIRSLGVGGAERQLVELAKALDREAFDIRVLCFYPDGAFVQELLSAGIPVISLDKRGRWEVCRFLLRLAKELRKQAPDILHGYMMGPNLMALLMKPILLWTRVVWGVRVSNINIGSHGWAEWLLSRLEALLSPLSSLVIFNSAAGESYCRGRSWIQLKVHGERAAGYDDS